MMVEFKWISLFLTAVLQFTAAAEKPPLYFTVRVGDEVTLPCENVIDGQQKCEYTTWVFVGSGNTAAVELVELGQILNNTKAKSDRLSVTENCSLVIKNVTVEDVGCYTCRQFKQKGGQQQGEDSLVLLSVINMTEHKDTDKVTLNCSVLTHGEREHTVKWLYEGKDVDKDDKDMKTSQSVCYATVSFLDSHFSYKSKSNLKCEVTDGSSGKVQLFTFSPQSSGEKTGDARKTAITKPTPLPPPPTTATESTKSITTNENSTKPATTTTATNDTSKPGAEQTFPGQWTLIFVFVGVAALLITIIALIMWKRTTGKKTQMDENTGRSLNPAVSPESSQDTADPEDGVSYASISYTRKTNGKGRVLGKDGDDEDDAVTYSSVKASSSSAGASADPSDLYATVN